MLVLRLGISDRMNTERIKIPMAKSKTQTKVYLISLGVYGLSIRSLLVHSQGGQVLEKRHHYKYHDHQKNETHDYVRDKWPHGIVEELIRVALDYYFVVGLFVWLRLICRIQAFAIVDRTALSLLWGWLEIAWRAVCKRDVSYCHWSAKYGN